MFLKTTRCSPLSSDQLTVKAAYSSGEIEEQTGVKLFRTKSG
ncbi:MAG: hypothetical protein ACRCXZ_02640 [Patescibacteria group bacterium]